MRADGGAGDAEGAGGGGDVAVVEGQDAADVGADDVGEFGGGGRDGGGIAQGGGAGGFFGDEVGQGAVGEEGGAFEDVLEFADVSGPVVGRQCGKVVGGKGFALGGGGFPVGAGDGGDVVGALAQGGEAKFDEGEAEVEVRPEAAFADERGEVAVGRGDDADVHRVFGGGAHGLDARFLEDAQEESLGFEGQFGDFVEEDGAAVGVAEESGAVFGGAGEGALAVAEEAGFEEVAGGGGAVEGQERAAAAGLEVQLQGDGFLAGAIFASDEDARGGGGGDAAEVAAEGLGGGAVAEEDAGAVAGVGVEEPAGGGGPAGGRSGGGEVADEGFEDVEVAGVGEGPGGGGEAVGPGAGVGGGGVAGEVRRETEGAGDGGGEGVGDGVEVDVEERGEDGRKRVGEGVDDAMPGDGDMPGAKGAEDGFEAGRIGGQADAEEVDGSAGGRRAGFEDVREGGLAGEGDFGAGEASEGKSGRGADFGECAESGNDQGGGRLFHRRKGSAGQREKARRKWQKIDRDGGKWSHRGTEAQRDGGEEWKRYRISRGERGERRDEKECGMESARDGSGVERRGEAKGEKMAVLRQIQTVEKRSSRMKMDAGMWNVVLFNLCEANGDLRELCAVTAYLEEGKAPAEWEEFIEGRARKRGFRPGWFEVTMEHVYHHVNYAWNCRHAGAERAAHCAMRDFNRWEKFPKDWPELWPSPEQWKGKWPKGRWAEHGWRTVRAAMRPEFEAAEDALGLLIDGVFLRLGDDLDPRRRRPEKLREDAWAVTEQDFGVLIRRFYEHFNAAWNARRCRKPSAGKRRSSLFPREMARFWPESGMLPKFRKGAVTRENASRRGRRGRRE